MYKNISKLVYTEVLVAIVQVIFSHEEKINLPFEKSFLKIKSVDFFK